MDLSFLYAYGLIAIALVYSYFKNLEIERVIARNSVIALVQLMTLGFVLGFALNAQKLWQIGLIMLVMLMYASYIAHKRTALRANGFIVSFVVLFGAAVCTVLSLLAIGVIKPTASHIIPLFGMALGNSLNVYSQFIERLRSDIKLSIERIEGKMSLGATLEQATLENVIKSTKASLLPTVNQLETVGIVHIPGVTVGMLLAGANPIDAVSFQLVIMFMMVAIALFTAILAGYFGVRRVID